MALKNLQLSLQFGNLKDAARHRAALPRHSVTRWIRHALENDARSPCVSWTPKKARR